MSPVPSSLLDLQTWIARLLVRPLRETDSLDLPVYDGETEKEIESRITAGPRLTPQQRIAIYNQQYWFRLLNLMQADFPLLVRLFGYFDFNRRIAEPYLLKYVPDHWCLANLGGRVPRWIEEEYHDEDKHLVLGSAQIDEGYNRLFFAPQHPPLASKDLGCLDQQLIFLQPSVALFAFEADLFTFRTEMLAQEPEHWMEADFPKIHWSKERYFALHCTYGIFGYVELSQGEYALLKAFEKGAKLDAALSLCSAEMVPQISGWFSKWAQNNWLTLVSG